MSCCDSSRDCITSAFSARFYCFAPRRGRGQFYLILGHLSNFLQKRLLQRLSHQYYVICWLVVNVAVGKHGVEVLHALTGTAVVVIFQPLLNRTHVHGIFDDLMVVRQAELDSIHRFMEGPGKVVPPQRLEQDFL